MSSPLTAPSTKTALNAPRTEANGCVFGTMAGMHPHGQLGAAVDQLGDGQQLDGVPEPVGVGHVGRADGR